MIQGGVAPYQYQILNNSLPSGLWLGKGGGIYGTPQMPGIYFPSPKQGNLIFLLK